MRRAVADNAAILGSFEMAQAKVLRFELEIINTSPFTDIMFKPGGVVNKTAWRGKEPGSCAVTKLNQTIKMGQTKKPTAQIEVTYRPPGHITYDDKGMPKQKGWEQIVSTKEISGKTVYETTKPSEVDFNEVDFGTFIEEVDAPLKN